MLKINLYNLEVYQYILYQYLIYYYALEYYKNKFKLYKNTNEFPTSQYLRPMAFGPKLTALSSLQSVNEL